MIANNIKDLFKQFCKDRHAEDKGRNFDTLQEVYAKTELFDLSFLDHVTGNLQFQGDVENNDTWVLYLDEFKNISLPFEVQFAKLPDSSGSSTIFLREYAPNIITGAIEYKADAGSLNSPFTIRTETGKFLMQLDSLINLLETLEVQGYEQTLINSFLQDMLENIVAKVWYALHRLTNLPKYSVVTDTPKHSDYYTRKHGSTIKLCKPIYYILDKNEEKEKRNYKRIKPVGHLAFDHSFKVIGHWRKISPHTYGKNRNGEYIVTGMTWVKEHTRGEGDLIKKIRVVK